MATAGPIPGEGAPDTVVEAIAVLQGDGYIADFHVEHGDIHCRARGEEGVLDVAVVERYFRFEGASDPDDEAIVFGIFNPTTGTRGTLVSGFGPSADPDVMDVLILLQRRTDAPS